MYSVASMYIIYMVHKNVSLLYRGVLYVEVILYSKECNWYTRCCPLYGGIHYRECGYTVRVCGEKLYHCLLSLLLSLSPTDYALRLWNIKTAICVAIFGGGRSQRRSLKCCTLNFTCTRIAICILFMFRILILKVHVSYQLVWIMH